MSAIYEGLRLPQGIPILTRANAEMSAGVMAAQMIQQAHREASRVEVQAPKIPTHVVFSEAELAHRGIGTIVNTKA